MVEGLIVACRRQVSAHGLQSYMGVFMQHAIDLAALSVLSESHLAEMGIPIGARMKIIAAVDDHRRSAIDSRNSSRLR